jgi:uncharacterized metal-binding protein
MAEKIPILFACSGCSNAGQLANDVALELNRRGIAEMSCLAGVGAAKPSFLRKLSDREVWIIDGCPVQCSLGVFEQVRERVDVYIRLHDLGVKKNADTPEGQAFDELIESVLQQVSQQKDQSKLTQPQRADRAAKPPTYHPTSFTENSKMSICRAEPGEVAHSDSAPIPKTRLPATWKAV